MWKSCSGVFFPSSWWLHSPPVSCHESPALSGSTHGWSVSCTAGWCLMGLSHLAVTRVTLRVNQSPEHDWWPYRSHSHRVNQSQTQSHTISPWSVLKCLTKTLQPEYWICNLWTYIQANMLSYNMNLSVEKHCMTWCIIYYTLYAQIILLEVPNFKDCPFSPYNCDRLCCLKCTPFLCIYEGDRYLSLFLTTPN